MRFELFDRCPPPLRYPNSEIVLFAPYYLSLSPGEYKLFDFRIALFPDDGEGFIIRTFPDLYVKKGISIQTFQLSSAGMLELVLHNLNNPQPKTVIGQFREPGQASLSPNEPVCILSVFQRKDLFQK